MANFHIAAVTNEELENVVSPLTDVTKGVCFIFFIVGEFDVGLNDLNFLLNRKLFNQIFTFGAFELLNFFKVRLTQRTRIRHLRPVNNTFKVKFVLAFWQKSDFFLNIIKANTALRNFFLFLLLSFVCL